MLERSVQARGGKQGHSGHSAVGHDAIRLPCFERRRPAKVRGESGLVTDGVSDRQRYPRGSQLTD